MHQFQIKEEGELLSVELFSTVITTETTKVISEKKKILIDASRFQFCTIQQI